MKFLDGIILHFKSDEMKELIKEARDNKALSNNSDDDMIILVTDKAKDILLGLLSYKSKSFKEMLILIERPE